MRLIDADAIKYCMDDSPLEDFDWDYVCRWHIDSMPTIDAESVRHGRWIEREVFETDGSADIGEWQSARCSVCGRYHTTPYSYYFTEYEFCPHCGSKMDGGAE